IGGELAFEKPTYTGYLIRQLEGLSASPGSGFTLWNASGRYYMVTPELRKYTGYAEAEGFRNDEAGRPVAAFFRPRCRHGGAGRSARFVRLKKTGSREAGFP